MRFFIPHLRDDPIAAELEWSRYLRESGAPSDSRRIYAVTYHHDGAKYIAKVGEPRKVFNKRTGPRGGYIKNSDYVGYGSATGTLVSGIVDSGGVLNVWSYGPPFDGWANPSMVGRNEIVSIEYFEDVNGTDGSPPS